MTAPPSGRHVLVRVLVCAAAAVVAGLCWWNPTSPFGLDRANAAYLSGDSDRARAIYEQVAGGWGLQGTRQVAAERAALLHLEAGRGESAVHWLRVAIPLSAGADRTRLQRLLGFVYTSRFDDHRRAGEVYADAADAAEAEERDDDARTLGVEAARSYARAESWDEAETAWNRVIPHLVEPGARAEAEAAVLRAAQRQTEAAE